MKIAFLPIDNRPVCYTLPILISKIDEEIELSIPPRNFLGDLTKSADIENLFNWLTELPTQDAIILSLDTIAYGGLISSRRSEDTLDQIKARLEKLKEILISKNAKIYAFSSIMRISNNNYNEEEKEYWSKWGKRIFDYSYQTHKLGCESCIATTIPSDILDDYINTRKRNFEVNKIYLEWQKQGIFDTLVFSKDDCAQYGFNVQEAQILESLGAFTKTGADEIPLTLLARAIKGSMKIFPVFLEPDCKDLISNYEDISIEKSVKGQIELAGCEISQKEEADVVLYVNNFKDHQGEIVMKIPTENFNGKINFPKSPYMIADVRFANGADENIIKELMKTEIKDETFFGYSAWNTSANTLGSLICAAKVKFLANKYNKENFKKLQATRLLDDWAYQTGVRQRLEKADTQDLTESMESYESIVNDILKYKVNAKYSFPWNRLFEVEIELN